MQQPTSPQPRLRSGHKPVKGVFSIESQKFLGIGGIARAGQRLFFYAEQPVGSDQVLMQRLSRDFIPTGTRRAISREQLFTQYQPEPSVYLNKVVPVMRRLEEAVSAADGHRERQELFAAEFEYKGVLQLDEEHVRAAFGLGLTYLERQEKHNADVVFHKIMRIEAAFTPEHKHLFNEFGIQMRKLGMYDEAMRYYSQAYRLCDTDEHLLYNMARTLFEKGRLKSCRAMLAQALRLNPEFPEGRAFLAYLESLARGEAATEPPLSAVTLEKPPGALDEPPPTQGH
jgi:tetratricopeptide (TPR) repeat protein